MQTRYLVAPRDKPYLILFTARTLEVVAGAVAAQPDPGGVLVYANVDDISRDLNPGRTGAVSQPAGMREEQPDPPPRCLTPEDAARDGPGHPDPAAPLRAVCRRARLAVRWRSLKREPVRMIVEDTVSELLASASVHVFVTRAALVSFTAHLPQHRWTC